MTMMMVPDSTKPLREPMMSYHQHSPENYFVISAHKLAFKISTIYSGAYELWCVTNFVRWLALCVNIILAQLYVAFYIMKKRLHQSCTIQCVQHLFIMEIPARLYKLRLFLAGFCVCERWLQICCAPYRSVVIVTSVSMLWHISRAPASLAIPSQSTAPLRAARASRLVPLSQANAGQEPTTWTLIYRDALLPNSWSPMAVAVKL